MVIKDLIKSEKPCILLIQETKMKSEEVIKIGKSLWCSSESITEDTRGASDGICTFWNDHEVSMEYHLKTHHWIITKFKHK